MASFTFTTTERTLAFLLTLFQTKAPALPRALPPQNMTQSSALTHSGTQTRLRTHTAHSTQWVQALAHTLITASSSSSAAWFCDLAPCTELRRRSQ
uniref:Putative secreted protein n=1 Tax=Anopheles triannulatus TaxID=58253 RepID=A0A2M4B439_9DIPT